ncbi:Hypothetical predicted protein [Octopus vulgaris]|uniref:Uncharacterized protein n=1 Tax=Octopus vulgaris TaxID=6645 RepID=A0AA36F7D4_OCTVU|nr:Hypothetical predicted protein [Octopus vulgaris]
MYLATGTSLNLPINTGTSLNLPINTGTSLNLPISTGELLMAVNGGDGGSRAAADDDDDDIVSDDASAFCFFAPTLIGLFFYDGAVSEPEWSRVYAIGPPSSRLR